MHGQDVALEQVRIADLVLEQLLEHGGRELAVQPQALPVRKCARAIELGRCGGAYRSPPPLRVGMRCLSRARPIWCATASHSSHDGHAALAALPLLAGVAGVASAASASAQKASGASGRRRMARAGGAALARAGQGPARVYGSSQGRGDGRSHSDVLRATAMLLADRCGVIYMDLPEIYQ